MMTSISSQRRKSCRRIQERDLILRLTSRPPILEEDRDLRLITARKMAELRRRMGQAAAAAAAPPKGEQPQNEKSEKEIVLGMLYDRGDEVLEAAMARYPTETK